MSKFSPSLIKSELAKRAIKELPNFFDGNFKVQQDFIAHPARFKALFCTRRFGKSYTGGLYLVKEAYENPGVSCVYVALTRESAQRIMIKDVLVPINKRFKLGMRFNKTTLTCSLPNGSVIYLGGADNTDEEMDKLLGQKYKLGVVDESASYSIDLRKLIYGALKPAMADLNGTIVMLGTPGNLTKSLFYDITTGAEPGWHVVKGNTADNPYMADKWRKEILEITQQQPYIVETPVFKQMYLGDWVVDTDALVYKFNQERNLYDTLPISKDWQFLLGVDLGYEDASAFVVTAFNSFDKNLYVIDTYSKSKMDITDVANKIRELKAKYDIHKVVIDGANKQAVEEIQKRHQLPLITADKTGKEDFIEIMNAELILGRIKVHKVLGAPLVQEWQNLIWLEKGNKRVENPACDNHLCDACLYIWRYSYQYLSVAAPVTHKYGSAQWAEQQVSDMEQAAIDHFTALEEAYDPDWT